MKDLKKKYDSYANTVLINRLDNTKELVTATTALMNEIEASIHKMVNKLKTVENELD